MQIRIVGRIHSIETIAAGRSVRMAASLRRRYGGKRWRKLKGVAVAELADGSFQRVELHWYEAHGIGRKKMKIKRLLD